MDSNVPPDKLRSFVLYKLARRRLWGGKHTSIDNLPKGVPKHLWKDVREAVQSLIKEGLILTKPTSYGLEVSLDPRKKKEILKIIEKHYG